jgi:hypothetical protein
MTVPGLLTRPIDEEVEEVVAWRREQLRRAGCRRFEAEILARQLRVDLHEAIGLLERGCPPRIAVEILI